MDNDNEPDKDDDNKDPPENRKNAPLKFKSFSWIKFLGEGAYGEVHLYYHESKKTYFAVKIEKKQRSSMYQGQLLKECI